MPMPMWDGIQPWESDFSRLKPKELEDLFEQAKAENDWDTMTKLQQPFESGKPPAGFGYKVQSDFVDRRR